MFVDPRLASFKEDETPDTSPAKCAEVEGGVEELDGCRDYVR